jgi:hypothetical protein
MKKALFIIFLALFSLLIGDLGTQTNPAKYWAFMAMDLSLAGYCMYQLLRDAWKDQRFRTNAEVVATIEHRRRL